MTKRAASFILCLIIFGCIFVGCNSSVEISENNRTAAISEDENMLENTLTNNDADHILFIDAESGNDNNAGTMEAPLKTIHKAQEKARNLLKNADSDVIVYLRGGIYELSESLIYTDYDSGAGEHYMIYSAYQNEKVVISGGTAVTNWAQHDTEKNIWAADAKGIFSRDFYVNGVRAVRARSVTRLKVKEFDDSTVTVAADQLANLARPQDVEFVLKNYWNLPRIGADSATTDDKNNTVFKLAQPGWTTYFETASLGGEAVNRNHFYYAENAYEFMDEPGEWYLNTEEDKIYYIPRDGEDLSQANTVLGRLEQLIEFKGSKSSPVKNIAFFGIQFSHTTWMQAESNAGLLTIQANFYKREGMTPETQWDNTNWMKPSAAIYGEITSGIQFERNTFTNLGNAGIHLGTGTKFAQISKNRFADCAGTGIMLGGFSHNDHDCINVSGSNMDANSYMISECNVITDNYIENCASVYSGGTGICVGYVRKTDVSYNTLLNLPYTAISFGWGWGFNDRELDNQFYRDENGKSLFSDNSITHNYIENIMNVLFDGGGIYTMGRNDNSIITDNYINLVNNDYGAIYLDDGSCGFTVTNNVVANSYRNYIYKGDYNYIFDNYTTSDTAKQPDFDLRRPLVEGEYHYRFENNYRWDEDVVSAIRAAAGVRD